MRWRRLWTVDVPGVNAHAVGVHQARVLIADGWGVPFAALRVRCLDLTTGHPLAEVRTRSSVRAFGRCGDDAIFVLGDHAIGVHDAATLERRSKHDRRVPRYANAICDLGGGTVALAAPAALIEYDLGAGTHRRRSALAPVGLGLADRHVLGVLENGQVVDATIGWQPIGAFEGPHYIATTDDDAAVVAALAGQRGNPWPRSRVLRFARVRGGWRPTTVELPFAAASISIMGGTVGGLVDGTLGAMVGDGVGEHVVAVAIEGDDTLVTCVPVDAGRAVLTIDTLSGRFVGFAGRHGVLTAPVPSPHDESLGISLFAPG